MLDDIVNLGMDLLDKIFGDPDYDIMNDSEEVFKPRTCCVCGCSFNYSQATDEYNSTVNDPSHMYSVLWDLCGQCAIEDYYEYNMDKNDDDDDDREDEYLYDGN